MSPVPISSTSISLVPPSSVPIGAARHAQCSWSALHSRWVLWGMAFGVMVALTTPHPSKAAPVKLAFTGDVALTGAVGPSEATTTVPWAENPLRWMSPTLAAADLAVVNFEGVMTSKPWTVRPVGKSVLWVPFSGASVFMPAGVDLVSLANNHSYDAGALGLRETVAALRERGVAVMGAGDSIEEARQPYIHPINDTQCVAIIPATVWSNRWDHNHPMKLAYYARDVPMEQLLERITAARSRCQIVVVYVHWGAEKTHLVRTAVRTQAQRMVAAGANLIVGHHAHVLKGVEFIDGVPVVYSLGNFVFGHSDPKMRLGGVLWVQIDPEHNSMPSEVALIPSYIVLQREPPVVSARPTIPRQNRWLMRNMRAWCADLGTEVSLNDGKLYFAPQPPKPKRSHRRLNHRPRPHQHR